MSWFSMPSSPAVDFFGRNLNSLSSPSQGLSQQSPSGLTHAATATPSQDQFGRNGNNKSLPDLVALFNSDPKMYHDKLLTLIQENRQPRDLLDNILHIGSFMQGGAQEQKNYLKTIAQFFASDEKAQADYLLQLAQKNSKLANSLAVLIKKVSPPNRLGQSQAFADRSLSVRHSSTQEKAQSDSFSQKKQKRHQVVTCFSDLLTQDNPSNRGDRSQASVDRPLSVRQPSVRSNTVLPTQTPALKPAFFVDFFSKDYIDQSALVASLAGKPDTLDLAKDLMAILRLLKPFDASFDHPGIQENFRVIAELFKGNADKRIKQIEHFKATEKELGLALETLNNRLREDFPEMTERSQRVVPQSSNRLLDKTLKRPFERLPSFPSFDQTGEAPALKKQRLPLNFSNLGLPIDTATLSDSQAPLDFSDFSGNFPDLVSPIDTATLSDSQAPLDFPDFSGDFFDNLYQRADQVADKNGNANPSSASREDSFMNLLLDEENSAVQLAAKSKKGRSPEQEAERLKKRDREERLAQERGIPRAQLIRQYKVNSAANNKLSLSQQQKIYVARAAANKGITTYQYNKKSREKTAAEQGITEYELNKLNREKTAKSKGCADFNAYLRDRALKKKQKAALEK